MAKIFSAPKGVELPPTKFTSLAKYQQDCDDYEKKLKEKLLEFNPGGKNVGEIIRFQVADGYAQYMVASMKPLQLVHLEIGDAYNFEYANRLTAKDVQDKIKQQKALKEYFQKKNSALFYKLFLYK